MYTAMQSTIRQFSPSDTEAVITLWKECNLVVPWNDSHEDIRIKCDYQPELFLVAEDVNGSVVGSVMAGYDGHRGWINYLAVSPDKREKSIGTQLMSAAEEKLKSLGCPKINLQIRSSNTGVINFYEKIGYKQDDVVCYGKRL
jgi:ribosomal protein S18 acetylase RimI-like enzyme